MVDFCDFIENLSSQYSEFPLFQEIDAMRLDSFETYFLLDTIWDAVQEGDNNYNTFLQRTIDDFYQRKSKSFEVFNAFIKGENKLMKKGLVELSKEQFLNRTSVKLSDKMVKFLHEKEKMTIDNFSAENKRLISHKNLPLRQLFYNDDEYRQIQRISEILSDTTFRKLQKNLESRKMPVGIAVLLHGTPGTGKTESVYQLARKSGRNIFKVDISETKSMWFGESQKLIKKVFKDYREMCSTEVKMPILLFNEADGIIGKRKSAGSSNVADTENAIQNIILEEMENFEGILFATTNLVENMDAAFERRFLFKIKFDKPGAEVSAKIWKMKLPFLNDGEAVKLAENFHFSGGEIENIARKCVMNELLENAKPDYDTVFEMCRSEKWAAEVQEKELDFRSSKLINFEIDMEKEIQIIEKLLHVHDCANSMYELANKEGDDFNVFDLINEIYWIDEPKHSRFIAYLLNPKNSHGQGPLYLELFLDKLGIEFQSAEDRCWTVSAEKNNVDILIQSNFPDKISVVIENKCYDAVDQANQLYRYWYNSIYDYQKEKPDAHLDLRKNRVVYLPKGDWKSYDINSVRKPEASMPEMNLDVITNWTIQNEIDEWLSACIRNTKAFRIKKFIEDYQTFWRETTLRNLFMKDELQKRIETAAEWNALTEVLSAKNQLQTDWLNEFYSKMEKLATKHGWKFWKNNEHDYRIYRVNENQMSFCFEYFLGLTLWDNRITNATEKQKIKDKISDLFASIGDDFEFVNSQLNDYNGYLMKAKKDLVYSVNRDDHSEFAFVSNSGCVYENLESVLEKYLSDYTIKMTFDKLSNNLDSD